MQSIQLGISVLYVAVTAFIVVNKKKFLKTCFNSKAFQLKLKLLLKIFNLSNKEICFTRNILGAKEILKRYLR